MLQAMPAKRGMVVASMVALTMARDSWDRFPSSIAHDVPTTLSDALLSAFLVLLEVRAPDKFTASHRARCSPTWHLVTPVQAMYEYENL